MGFAKGHRVSQFESYGCLGRGSSVGSFGFLLYVGSMAVFVEELGPSRLLYFSKCTTKSLPALFFFSFFLSRLGISPPQIVKAFKTMVRKMERDCICKKGGGGLAC